MAYQALYRKYRPRQFSDVIGQEHITTILKNQITENHVAHAYLFTGTRGTGKTSTAKIFAKALNCEQPIMGEPCGKCTSCIQAEGGSVDIIELDAASSSSVENIRSLIDKARFMPLNLSKKVYIIDEAHALTSNAFNALLKTLEEPPAHVVFILATTEPQKILPTITSRCQRFDFHRFKIDDIVDCLSGVLKNAGVTIEHEGMLAIARAAEGGMRDALSLADQCIGFCGSNVTARDVYNVLGSSEGDLLFEVAEALITSNTKKALSCISEVMSSGRDLSVFTQELTQHFRALLIAKLCGDCCDVLDCTEDAMKRYIKQSSLCSEQRLLRASELLILAGSNIRYLPLPRIQLECTFVRITAPQNEEQDVSVLTERIEQLENKLKNASLSPAKENSSEDLFADEDAPPWDTLKQPSKNAMNGQNEDAAAKKAVSKNGENSRDKKAPLWENVKDVLRRKNPMVAVLATKAIRAYEEGEAFKVVFDNPFSYEAFMKQESNKMLMDALDECGSKLKISIEFEGENTLVDKAKNAFGDKLTIK